MKLQAVFFDMGGTIEIFGYTREIRLEATRLIQQRLDQAGKRLAEWMERAGLHRRDAYFMLVLPERPRGPVRAMPREELEHYQDELHRRLAALHDPWVLVPTEDLALQALTGYKSVHKYRGSVLEYVDGKNRRIKVIPALHPNEVFKKPSLERRYLYDWARIAGDSTFRDLRRPQRELVIRPTIKDVLEFTREACAKAKALSIDIETPRELRWTETRTKSGKVSMKKSYEEHAPRQGQSRPRVPRRAARSAG